MFPGETVLSSEGGAAKRDSHLSEFQVMSSAAGWYVGTVWTACAEESCSWGCAKDYSWLPAEERVKTQEPGTRETGYFPNEVAAQNALETYKTTGELPLKRY